MKNGVVLFLLGAWAVFTPLAEAQQQALTGWFTFIVADSPSEAGFTSEITYILTEDSGERHELLIDVELMRPLGGPMALNRKRATVTGEWESVGPDAPARFRASTIQLEPLEDEGTSPEGAYQALQATSQTAVSGSQAWVTILCRFGDATNVTPYPVSHYEKLMRSSYPGLDHYWRELSDGNINLTGSRVVGWYNLPRPRSYYLHINERGLEAFKQDRAVKDCTAVADADVFFPDFDGINLVFNQQGDADGSWSQGGGERLTLDGQARFYGVTWLHPDHSEAYPQTIAHEMGHAFGLQHSSGPYGQDDLAFGDTTYDSKWDVMSGGISLAPYPGYGYLGVHTIAYHKDFLGWIPPDRKYVARPNTTRTITLERLAQPSSGGYLMAQIPIGDSTTDFYTVETRLFAGYDDEIPDEAVIIHKVDTTLEDRLAQVVDVDNDGDTNDAGAMWTVGETFADLATGLQVSIDAAWSTSYRVTIDYTVCTDAFSSARSLMGGRAGTASVRVVAPSGCRWAAESNSPWITITAGSSGTGNGSVHYRVAANPSLNARTGTLIIGGRTLAVIQAGVNGNLFEDNMESETDGWEGDPSWARTTASAQSGQYAWTDSPRGNYQNDSDMNLWSPWSSPIDLTNVDSATLTFWHRFDFARGDQGSVWVARQREDGGWWTDENPLRIFAGIQPTWKQVSLDLSHSVGERIRLVFHLWSDAAHTADGWYIDDVVVSSPDFGIPSPPGTQPGTSGNLFEDDLESGTGGWWGALPWAQTTEYARSGTLSWTDSPGGNYQNDLNVSSLSPVIDLTEVDSATLTFWHRYDFGRGDEGNVWIARYGEWEGQDGWWFLGAPLQTFTGTQPTWEQVSLDLSSFVGERIRLGFQLLSDASETADGWYIDDVAVFTADPVAPAEVRRGFESPQAGPVSGIGVIQGWAFAEQAGVGISRVDLVLDGEVVGDIPCCSERGDVAGAFPQFPVENTRHSGWGLTYNWGLLSAGTHTLQLRLHTSEGTVVPTAVRTINVVKPGGFAYLDRFALAGASVALEGSELVVSGVVVRDKATQQEREVVTRFGWQENRQGFSLVGTEASAALAAGASSWGGLLAALPARLLGWIAPAETQAAPGLVATFEGPKAGQPVSGIGVINGWAFAEGPGETIQAVRLVVDGQAWGTIPCCSTRGDVAGHFPALPQALHSGWGLTFNYGLLPSGPHTFEVQLEASDGGILSRTHPVTVVRVGEFAFVDQFDLSGATVRREAEEIILSGVRIREKASQQVKRVTVRVRWFEGQQGLGIVAAHDETSVSAALE